MLLRVVKAESGSIKHMVCFASISWTIAWIALNSLGGNYYFFFFSFSSVIDMHVIKISPSYQRHLQKRELWDDFTHPSPAPCCFVARREGKGVFIFTILFILVINLISSICYVLRKPNES